MSLSAVLRLVALGLLVLPAGSLPAQVHAACCRCASFFEVHPTGAGFLRHHVGFCSKCKSEMGGSPEAYLEKLQGRHAGLADAARLTNDRLREKIHARDAARDSIYGREGLATKFFTSLISLASEGVGQTFKAVAKGVKEGLKRYNQVADTLEGDVGWVLEEGKGWVKKQTVGAAEDQVKLKAAAAIGRGYYERTKDARGATNEFLKAHGDIKKGVSILQGAIDFHEKTGKLADAIQEYLEHRADAQRLEKEWNEATDGMLALEEEMKKLRHCLELMEQQAQGKSAAHPGHEQPWVARFAQADSIALERQRIKALVYPANEPSESSLRSALGSLRLVERDFAELIRQLEHEYIPPVLPFWYDLQPELGRELSVALLTWAEPVTGNTSRLYDRAQRRAEGAADELKRSLPRE